MWHALVAALPLAESFLARIEGPRPSARLRKIGNHAETIVDVIKTARSKAFSDCCLELSLGPGSNDVADHPATFRFALMVARAQAKAPRK
jgi:hypothetical protein